MTAGRHGGTPSSRRARRSKVVGRLLLEEIGWSTSDGRKRLRALAGRIVDALDELDGEPSGAVPRSGRRRDGGTA